MNFDEESDEDLQDGKKKSRRKWNGKREFTLIKRWVTGEKAEMDSEDIRRELFGLARDWISQFKLKQLPGHQSKPTGVSLCGNSIASTRRRRGRFLFDSSCFDAHCITNVDVRPAFGLA
jgi:hypothetical protein